MEHIKNSVHVITNHMQAVIGYIELQQYDKALKAARVAAKEIRLLAKMLTGFALAVPADAAVLKVPSDLQVEVVPAVEGKTNVIEIVPKKGPPKEGETTN